LAPIAAVALAGTAAVALEPDEIFGDPALEACTRSISTGLPCLIWTISACVCGSGSTQVRWHDLRPTFASWHVQSGTDLYRIR